MLNFPIVAVQQQSSASTVTPQQQTARDLSRFLRVNKFMDFELTDDQFKQVKGGSTITIFPLKTIGMRDVLGSISKESDGKIYLLLTVRERDPQMSVQQEFERKVKEVYAGLHLRGTNKTFSSHKIEGLPTGWGAKIKSEIPQSGRYEISISASQHSKP